MPSTRSSSFSRPLPSSTVMTPSLPTLSIASAMVLPISGSALAEMAPTCAISLEVVHGLLIFFSSSTAVTTALSMPRFRCIGFMPAATYFMPSVTIDCASTVAVVVPSPATSEVLEATSFTSCAPMFSNLSFSSISFATDTPSLVTVGAPKERSSTTLRPFGPSVTLTASARMLTPAIMRTRACSLNLTSLAAMMISSRVRGSGASAVHDGHDVFFAHHHELVALDAHGGAGILAEEHLVADLEVDRDELAVLVLLAGSDGEHFALVGLLGGGVGNDDSRCGLTLFFESLDDHAVMQRTQFHRIHSSAGLGYEWGAGRGLSTHAERVLIIVPNLPGFKAKSGEIVRSDRPHAAGGGAPRGEATRTYAPTASGPRRVPPFP